MESIRSEITVENQRTEELKSKLIVLEKENEALKKTIKKLSEDISLLKAHDTIRGKNKMLLAKEYFGLSRDDYISGYSSPHLLRTKHQHIEFLSQGELSATRNSNRRQNLSVKETPQYPSTGSILRVKDKQSKNYSARKPASFASFHSR